MDTAGPSQSGHPHEERYRLGLPEMDEQHRYLYRLFDRIEQSREVVDTAATKTLLAEIERYLVFHFAAEEHLMRAYEAPGFAVHQSDHEAASTTLVRFLDDFDIGRLNPAAMRIFLTGWLMEHSATCDAEYATWILGRRTEVFGPTPGERCADNRETSGGPPTVQEPIR